jgi:hypothetical protein
MTRAGLEPQEYSRWIHAAAASSRLESTPKSHPKSELPVSNPKERVRIDLHDDQKDMIRNKTGKDAEALELSVEELEERIAPTAKPYKP